MPEEATAAPENQDTPTPEAPEPTAEQQPEVNWQERYTNLQADHTRAAQEAAQQRQLIEAIRSDDPQTRAQAAEALGLEFEEPEPEPLDDVEELRRELQDLKTWRDEETQAKQSVAQRQAEIDYMDEQFDALEKTAGELTDDDVELVASLAQQKRDGEGRPDVAGAYAKLQAYLDAATPRRVASKKAAQVQAGAQGAKELDFSDKKARRQAMAERMAAENAE